MSDRSRLCRQIAAARLSRSQEISRNTERDTIARPDLPPGGPDTHAPDPS